MHYTFFQWFLAPWGWHKVCRNICRCKKSLEEGVVHLVYWNKINYKTKLTENTKNFTGPCGTSPVQVRRDTAVLNRSLSTETNFWKLKITNTASSS
jgi:hypothetical protein